MNDERPMRTLIALLAILGGCATVSPPGSAPDRIPGAATPDASPAPAPAPPSTARRENIAVASLMERANADAKAGRLANAAASLERALRIEPRNPRLWHELARVRFQQGDYGQAESIAARANAWAQGDAALRAENWRLIAQAREARGDTAGTRTALETAERQK